MSNNKNQNGLLSYFVEGVYFTKILFVHAYFVDTPETDSWILVDTGLPLSKGKIRSAAEIRYGNRKPSAIVLTHGHFDHAGAAYQLAEEWNVPIYAHRLEMPFLNGTSDYPPQDPTVGGPLAQMSRFFPHGGYDFGNRIHVLPENGEIPQMPGWKYLHTPGHTNGHISLWRERDRALIAGDALKTANLDSWSSVIKEEHKFCKPAAPFTTDWQAARRSVELLAELEPKAVAPGHGLPITGANTARRLKDFARNFTPPAHGRYVNSPAICDENGVVALPPPATDYVKIAAGTLAAGIFVTAISRQRKKLKD